MFFTYRQNNSGGSFNVSNQHGHILIIEADDLEDANYFAQKKADIYFDGVSQGRDCGCCGDRWSEPYDGGSKTPVIYKTYYDGNEEVEDEDQPFLDYLKSYVSNKNNHFFWREEMIVDIYRQDKTHERFLVNENGEITHTKENA
jgi:hypothetical protein